MPCRTVIFIYYRNGAVIVILTIYVYSLKLYKNRNCENYDNILSLQFFKHTYMGPYHYKPYRIQDQGDSKGCQTRNEQAKRCEAYKRPAAAANRQPPDEPQVTRPNSPPPHPRSGRGGRAGRSTRYHPRRYFRSQPHSVITACKQRQNTHLNIKN